MWTAFWHQAAEVFQLSMIILGLSLCSLLFAAAALAII